VQAMEISLYPAYNAISKMIFSDPEMRKDIICIGGTSQWPVTIFRGIDQWGERYGYLMIDPIGGAIGAFAQADGISTGGQSRSPICKLPNIEHTEQTFPLLFLYRKEVPDSGGAGKFRGGLSAESCFIPHHTDKIIQDTLSSGNAVPTSTGLMGGYPGTPNIYRFRVHTDILERHKARKMIEDMDELQGEVVTLELRQENFVQEPTDVYAVTWSAAAGFGDPTDRDPNAVWQDIENRAITLEAARTIYCVVVDPRTGAVDYAATDKLRAKRRSDRVERRTRSTRKLSGPVVLELTEHMHVRLDDNEPHLSCARCATDLGPTTKNYKEGCLREDNPIGWSNPHAHGPERFIDAEPVFRQFFCPGCGSLVENEIATADEPLLADIELNVPLMARRQAAE
jgi:N-methylhydantoinase B